MDEKPDKKNIIFYQGSNTYGKNEATIRTTVYMILMPRWSSYTYGIFAPKQSDIRWFLDQIIKRCVRYGVEPLYESNNYVHFSSGNILIGVTPLHRRIRL